MAKARKGSKENPLKKVDIENLAKKIAGRNYKINEASIKDDFCNYRYEVTEGIGLGDTHGVTGAGIIKDELREALGVLHVHLAVMDEIFKHSGIEVEDIDTLHTHELTSLYRVTSFKIKDTKGAAHVTIKGTKYASSAGGWFDITSPSVAMDNLSSYKWYNELKKAVDDICEEVAKYREGNYIPVKNEEETDKDQGSLFDGKTTDDATDDEFEKAEV